MEAGSGGQLVSPVWEIALLPVRRRYAEPGADVIIGGGMIIVFAVVVVMLVVSRRRI
jgi:hypothetical protein